MPTPVASPPVALAVPADLLDDAEIGILHFRPVYAPGAPAEIVDLAYLRLNPTAQRLLRLPEVPPATFRTLHPQAEADFAFYRDTFLADTTGACDLSYPSGWRARARRHGTELAVSLTATLPPLSQLPAQTAASRLAASYSALARTRLAAQQLTQERDVLHRVLAQTPTPICLLRGPEYQFEYVNPAFARLFAHRALEGRPAAEVLPEALNQGFIALLDRVYETGETWLEAELPLASPQPGSPPDHPRYFNFMYQAHLENGHAERLSVFAYEVTEQVLARQQVQQLNQALAAANEELRANNATLASTQHQLKQLNEKLEARVAAGTWAAQQAHAEAEQQRERLARFFQQAPVAICVLDGPELVYELVNPVYQQYFLGRQLLGQPVQAVPELLAQNIPALLREVYETGLTHEGHEVELAIGPPGGGPAQAVYFNCVYQARYDEQGRIDGVLAFAYEVTEQVLARQQVQQLNEQLEARVAERTQQLHTIIEHAPVAISYLEGPDLRLTLLNPAAYEVWSGTEPELLGQPLLEALPLLQGQGFEQLLRETMRTQVPFVGREMPVPVQRNGQPGLGYFNFVYQPLPNKLSGTTGVLTVAVEVTEQVLARQQVQQLNEQLEARVAERTRQLQAALHEAKQQRGQLCEQQSLLRQILGQLPAAVATLAGPEHRFVFFNETYQAIANNRAQLGRPVAEALPELVEQGFVETLDQVYATSQPHQGLRQPARMQQAGADEPALIYVDFLYQPLKDAQGQTQGILAFIVEVTEHVLAQQRTLSLQAEVQAAAQRQAQEREVFYQVFAQTPALVALLRGPGFRIDYVNPAFEQLFPGRPLLGLALAEALPELISPGFVRRLAGVLHTGEAYFAGEAPLPLAPPAGEPGRQRYLDLTCQRYLEAGQPAGVSVFAFEVSEQVRARQQRDAGLHQLQQLFEQAPVAVAVLAGPSYLVEVVSPALCTLLHCTQAHLLGRPLPEALPELATPAFLDELARVRRTGQSFIAHERAVQLGRPGQPETVYFHLVCQPLPDAQGQVAAVVVVVTDVSARVVGRQQLAQANEDLLAINQQLTRTNIDLDNFIYAASHDLKAPIANIESLLLLLRQQLPAEARQAGLVPRVLGMMQGAIERFQLTIAQLTDLAQLQQTYSLPPEAADLAAVVEAVRLDLGPQLEEAGGQLTLDLADCPSVPLAPQHLRSVVYNLLSNGFKYRHPRRPPQVLLRCYREAGRTVLAVQDNGLGLSEQQQARLFELFRRLHAHVGGSGVGLYMVKRIVENAGGTLTVRSQLGEGSTFLVILPG
ncbi:PAS domain-containing protein [Hymenobacter cheonanensis]|uniref:PAS domain-containing protein n=1 Tax=Hymenobacter sp. CA2-7 TaxID=3063993 RepID=UPI0027134B54|nr:PAS domain-containing protein [Hymenobacter sp. CA2-7]MDO7886585.1 PAS domain-containing protein [Hymenobacter sp. CA2-7]